jgi:hypothetical protein
MPEQPAFYGPAAFGRDQAVTRDHDGQGVRPAGARDGATSRKIPRATYWRAVIFSLMRAALPLKWRV